MRFAQRIQNAIVTISASLAVVMVLLVTLQVLARYVFKSPVAQTDELARYAMIWSSLLGAAVIMGTKGHVALTFFVDRFPDKTKRFFVLFAHICVIVFCLLIITNGVVLTKKSMIQFSTTLPIRMGYVVAIIPLFGGVGLLFALKAAVVDFLEYFNIKKENTE